MGTEDLAPDKQLSKEDILATIDWELKTLAEGRTVLGATAWSLLVGLGATIWLLLSQAVPWSALPRLCYLVILLWLPYESMSGVLLGFYPLVRPVAVYGFLVRLSERFAPAKRMFWALSCTTIGLIACTILSRSLLPHGFVHLLVILLSLRLLLLVVVQALASLPLLAEDKPAKPKRLFWGAVIVRLLAFVLSVAPASWLWYSFLREQPTIDPIVLRAAALVCVARVLLDLVLLCASPTPQIGPLQGIRRAVALDLLTPDEATQQVRATIVGLRRDDVRTPLLLEIQANYAPLLTALAVAVENLKAQRDEIRAATNWTASVLSARRETLLKEHAAESNRLTTSMKTLKTLQSRLWWRVKLQYTPLILDVRAVIQVHSNLVQERVDERNAITQEIGEILRTAVASDDATTRQS